MNEHATRDLKTSAALAIEDALYLQADKLLALCSVQAAWGDADYTPSPAVRNHYSIVLEEQALEMRRLLDRLYP